MGLNLFSTITLLIVFLLFASLSNSCMGQGSGLSEECLNQNPLTAHILDTMTGFPASDIDATLFKWNPGSWVMIASRLSNDDGRMGDFIKCEDFVEGIYKMIFNTKPYFEKKNADTFYPYVEIVFEVANNTSHYHIPLLLSPFGYTTYRGS